MVTTSKDLRHRTASTYLPLEAQIGPVKNHLLGRIAPTSAVGIGPFGLRYRFGGRSGQARKPKRKQLENQNKTAPSAAQN